MIYMDRFVVLVEIPKWLGVFNWPKVGDYDNPYIKKIIPCTVTNGAYKSWETGEKVEKTPQMFVWNLFPGTMFRMKDNKEILITRDFAGKVFLTSKVHFNPSSMVRYCAK